MISCPVITRLLLHFINKLNFTDLFVCYIEFQSIIDMSSVYLSVLNSGEMDSFFFFVCLLLVTNVNINYVESEKKWRLFFEPLKKWRHFADPSERRYTSTVCGI